MIRRFAATTALFVAVGAGISAFGQPGRMDAPPPGAVPAPGTQGEPPRAGATADTSSPVPFTREVSQTSVWPGDRFTYTVTLTVPQGMKISLDDFDRKAVNFKPFTLTDTQRATEELEDGVIRYKFVYLLNNFEIGDRTIEIPRVIFHYQKSQTTGKEPATAEVHIPPQPIAIRSTLTGPYKESWILENLRGDTQPSRAWVMYMALGIAGVIISLIPLVVWGVAQIPQWRNRERKISRSKFQEQCSRSLGVLGKGLDKGLDEVKRQYEALEGVAHQYVEYNWNIPAAGLTGEELTRKLEKKSGAAKQSQVLAKVLDHGQDCRYSANSGSDWTAIFQQDLRDLKSAVGSK